MDKIESIVSAVNGAIWGPFSVFILMMIGVYLTFKTGFVQIAHPKFLWDNTLGSLIKSDKKNGNKGGVSPFRAVTTALAGSVGVGSISGVAGAIALGGAGSIFWMWVSSFFGMATKYAETALAVKFRRTNDKGENYGGPMYYIEDGLKMKWPAVIFAALGGLASFGIGNITQASEIFIAARDLFKLPDGFHIGDIYMSSSFVTGAVITLLAAFALLGGISRISKITVFFVPFMSLFYIFLCTAALVCGYDCVVDAFWQIFSGAFSLKAVGGGVGGYVITRAIKVGVMRGVFSNESGMGSAPIAHAASTEKSPQKQAAWAVFEVAVDSFVISTITALVIIISGKAGMLSPTGELLMGGDLTALAFESVLGGFGSMMVRVSVIFFAMATIFGWSYYGEQCFAYLFNGGNVAIRLYKLLFSASALVGTSCSAVIVWDLSDILNGLMTIPNIAAVIALMNRVELIGDTKDVCAVPGGIKKCRTD